MSGDKESRVHEDQKQYLTQRRRDRRVLKMIKNILLHPYWLVFSLSAIVVFFFLPSPGAMEYSILLTGLILFIHLAYGSYAIKAIPRFYLIVVIICAFLMLSSMLFSYAHTDTHRLYRVIRMLIILFAIHCFSRQHAYKQLEITFVTILTILIIGQFIVRTFLGRPYGTYINPHHLAQLASLTLPFIFYYCWIAPKAYKFFFIAVGILDLDLLLRTSSRPAILALGVSTMFALIFLVRGRRKWIGLLTIVFGTVALYLTPYADVVSQIRELIVNLSQEERVQFWTDTWKMLQHNSLTAWIIGNGIGSFPDFFPKYSIPEYSFFSFPHNHVLQILFDNGLIGVIVVLGWQISLVYLLVKSSYGATAPKLRLFINCVAVAYLTWAIFTSLTVGFYSRFSLYPFAFISGIILILAERVLPGSSSTSMLISRSLIFNQDNQDATDSS